MTAIGVVLASIVIPTAILIASLLLIKWLQRRGGRRSPLVGKMFHQPGEQLRKRIEAADESITEYIGRIVVVGPLMLLAVLLPQIDLAKIRWGWGAGTVALLTLLFLAWNIRGLKRQSLLRLQAKQGLAAELMTAQQLLPLLEKGCLIYHDIPAGKFNLDHVVIGPNGVFVVETKSRLKPQGKGKEKSTVLYDGKGLQFPDHATVAPVDQARNEARWLAEYLRNAAGEPVPVMGVVSLPGWFVSPGKDAHRSDVAVINPKMHGVFLDVRKGMPLSPSLRTRIAHALAQRYPETDNM